MSDQADSGIRPGDVVQLRLGRFAMCFMVVERVESWGLKGYIESPGDGRIPYRCQIDKIKRIGRAEWPKAYLAKLRGEPDPRTKDKMRGDG